MSLKVAQCFEKLSQVVTNTGDWPYLEETASRINQIKVDILTLQAGQYLLLGAGCDSDVVGGYGKKKIDYSQTNKMVV